MNTHVRDNFNTTAPAVVAGKGEIVVGTAANAVDGLAAGTNGYGLNLDSSTATGLLWTPQPVGLDHSTTITSWASSTDVKTLYTKAITQSLYVSSKNRMLHFTARGANSNNSGSTCTFIYVFNYGAAAFSLHTTSVPTGYTGWCPVFIDVWVTGDGATNAQIISGLCFDYITASPFVVDATGTVDSTASVTVSLTCQMNQNHSTSKNRITFARLELYTN
jgi:hypothetical protein